MPDTLAAEASDMTQDEIPISFETARACTKRYLYEEYNKQTYESMEEHYKEVCKGHKAPISHLKRKDQILIHQLRIGKSPIARNNLAIYKNLDENEKLCQNGCNVKETVKHLFYCPLYDEIRLRVFGKINVSLSILNENPDEVMKYLSYLGRTSVPPIGGMQ